MSDRCQYLFYYQEFFENYAEKDKEYLENSHGGKVIILSEAYGATFFYEKPHSSLTSDDFDDLYADQIMRKVNDDPWRIVRCREWITVHRKDLRELNRIISALQTLDAKEFSNKFDIDFRKGKLK